MGLFDLIFGRKQTSGDDLLDVERERKAYGNLFSGGAGHVNHDNPTEANANKYDRSAERKVSRLQGDLRDVERRARGLHVYDDGVRKKMGKVESSIGRVSEANSAHDRFQQNAKLRKGLQKSYGKIKEESEQRLEKMRRDGASEHRIREAELKLDRMRRDMSSMYRRSGGSGMLK